MVLCATGNSRSTNDISHAKSQTISWTPTTPDLQWNEAKGQRRMEPRQIELITYDESRIGNLKFLLISLFPVRFKASFFQDLLNNAELSQLAFYKGSPVGCLCSKKEQDSLYITALGVLPAYRRLGIGSMLLANLLAKLRSSHSDIRVIYLHVQSDNLGAIKFYTKHSFERGAEVSDYYATTRTTEKNAIILVRNL